MLNILERIPASKCSLWKNQVSAPLVARLCLGQESLLLLDLKRKTKSHVLYSLPLNRIFRTIKQVTCRCNYRQRETLNGFLAF